MDHDNYDDTYIRSILNTAKSIAMVGVSANVSRPSYFAFKYLLERGYRTADLLRAGDARQAATSTQEMGALVHSILNDTMERHQSLHAVWSATASVAKGIEPRCLNRKLSLKRYGSSTLWRSTRESRPCSTSSCTWCTK